MHLTPAQELEQELLENETRKFGMTTEQARDFIKKDNSYQCESPLNYILWQLALIQDDFQNGRQYNAQKQLNRLRLALVENFIISKIVDDGTKLGDSTED